MNANINVEGHLRKKVRLAIASHILGSMTALIFGIVAVFVTFWVVYGIFYWGFQWVLPHSHQTRLICSGVFMVLIFIGHARTDREYLNTFKVDTLDWREPYTISVPHVGLVSNLNFLSPNTINSLTKILVQLWFIGPQLLSASWRLARRTVDLSRINVTPAACLVDRLRSSKGRVPFADLGPMMDAETMDAALRDLQMLDAIQFLESKPPGIMLTSGFRRTLDPSPADLDSTSW